MIFVILLGVIAALIGVPFGIIELCDYLGTPDTWWANLLMVTIIVVVDIAIAAKAIAVLGNRKHWEG